MDANDNPYDILGVSATATAAEIRSSYRKLALQTHPDKQRNEQDRQRATQRFAKVSNAYEILSDPEQKRQYDRLLQQRGTAAAAAAAAMPPWFATTTTGGGGMPDIFQQFFRHSMFHDPFQVFEQFFRDEMMMAGGSTGGWGSAASMRSSSQGMVMGAMRSDPFSLMMGGSSGVGGFMGGPSLLSSGAFGGDLFGMGAAAAASSGGGLGSSSSMFGTAAPHLNAAMINAGASPWNTSTGMQQQQQQMATTSGGSSSMFFSSSSMSSSSQMFGGAGGTGETVTVQTSMRSINGQPPQMVRERIVQKADGSIERTVTVSEDRNTAPSNHLAALEAPLREQQPSLPPTSFASLQQPPIADRAAREDAGTKTTARRKRRRTENIHQNETLDVKRTKETPNGSDNPAKKAHRLPDTATKRSNPISVNDAERAKNPSVTNGQETELPVKEETKAPAIAASNGKQDTAVLSSSKKTTGIINKSITEHPTNDSASLSSSKESSNAATRPANLSFETETKTSSAFPNEASKCGSDHDGTAASAGSTERQAVPSD